MHCGIAINFSMRNGSVFQTADTRLNILDFSTFCYISITNFERQRRYNHNATCEAIGSLISKWIHYHHRSDTFEWLLCQSRFVDM